MFYNFQLISSNDNVGLYLQSGYHIKPLIFFTSVESNFGWEQLHVLSVINTKSTIFKAYTIFSFTNRMNHSLGINCDFPELT